MREYWKSYLNGNCITSINLIDGTKVHETQDENDDKFTFDFAESCDLNISNRCDGGCQWCYQGCTFQGKHADLRNVKFFDTLHPFTELAINGNDLSHPDLVWFLEKMRDKEVIVSMTVNQKHFMRHIDFIRELMSKGLIKGLGVSLVDPTEEFIDLISQFPNAIIHVIAGIVTKEELDKLSDHNLKILILGYKATKNRGKAYYEGGHKEEIESKIKWLSENLYNYFAKFGVVSCDNLCIKQLDIRSIIGEKKWEERYMGDDGECSFFIDLVSKKFAKSSVETEQYDLLDNIDDMFRVIKEGTNNGR